MESLAQAGSVRRRGARGGIAALIAAPAAILGTAMLIHLVVSCHDTDAHTGIALNYLLWPIATPALWLAETMTLAGTFAACVRMIPSRRVRTPVMFLGTVVVLGLFTWTYWHIGLTTMSTGLVSPSCPAGAPAWWPSWLPLY